VESIEGSIVLTHRPGCSHRRRNNARNLTCASPDRVFGAVPQISERSAAPSGLAGRPVEPPVALGLGVVLHRAPAPRPSPPPPVAPPRGPDLASGPLLYLEHAAQWTAHRPWLAAVAIVVFAGYIAAASAVRTRRHAHHARGARLVTIAPPPEVDPAGAAAAWANLAGTLSRSWSRRLIHGTPHVVWEYAWAGRELTISVWVPGTIPAGGVEAAVRGAWPHATVATAPAVPPIPVTVGAAGGGHLLPVHADWLPFATEHGTDPLRAVIAAGSGLRDGEYAVVQILARPAPPRRARRARRVAGRIRDGRPATGTLDPGVLIRGVLDLVITTGSRTPGAVVHRDPVIQRDVRAVLDKTAHQLWETGVRYIVASTHTARGADPTPRIRGVSDALASAFAVYSGRNQLTHRTRMRSPVAVGAARRLGAGFLTCAPELAAMAGLPLDPAVPGLDRARTKAVSAPVAIPTGGRGMKVLGDAEVGGHAVSLPVADARYHMHMLGATGSGKTTLLCEMILQDIKARRGTVVIDPHGDLVLDVLDRLPAGVTDRLVLFDPDQPKPPVLNPLDGPDHQLLVDNIVSIMGSIFARAWGPRMDDVMRVACLTLLRHNNVTLQHIPPLLNSPQFRSEMTVGLDDPEGLSGFWQWYDEMSPALRSQVIGPVLARLRSFLLRDFVKESMGYPKSTFDMGTVLDGGILLARLPKGTLGEETSRLMGSLILARVWQAATARAAIPAAQRRDASIYLDEAQNFLTLASSLDSMLAEARKYRLSMILSHQDMAQFPRELLAAVSANARNKIYFSCSPEDAHLLSRHTLPELDEHDLTHLDAYTAIARLLVNGRQTTAFTMTTRPPSPIIGEATAIRLATSAKEPFQDTSAMDEFIRTHTRPPNDRQRLPAPDKH
jgi:Type IV secretion-system coupling protein DNA-binding domain